MSEITQRRANALSDPQTRESCFDIPYGISKELSVLFPSKPIDPQWFDSKRAGLIDPQWFDSKRAGLIDPQWFDSKRARPTDPQWFGVFATAANRLDARPIATVRLSPIDPLELDSASAR